MVIVEVSEHDGVEAQDAQAGKLAGTGPIGPGVDQHGTGAVTDQDGVSLPHVEHV